MGGATVNFLAKHVVNNGAGYMGVAGVAALAPVETGSEDEGAPGKTSHLEVMGSPTEVVRMIGYVVEAEKPTVKVRVRVQSENVSEECPKEIREDLASKKGKYHERLMKYELFATEGILEEDMPFIFRLFRYEDGSLIPEVELDDESIEVHDQPFLEE